MCCEHVLELLLLPWAVNNYLREQAPARLACSLWLRILRPMRFFSLFLACLTLGSVALHAQDASEYRSSKNPYYWKNRMPDANYWQQDIYCTINARIDEKDNRIDANQKLEYWNNSPDTLHYVFFHLYQNAFVKGSYLYNLQQEKGIQPRLGKHEAKGEGTIVSNIKVDGAAATSELDNTILKVNLNQPLPPGASVTFTMDFKTWWDNGSTRRRMQLYDAWGFPHYNGVQWFPKVCVYDRKMGWDTYQHLNKEFYGEFGVYDVKLDFPSNYIVEATGAIQNRDEVLPPALREKLDLKNFAKKPWNEAPSTIVPYVPGERKVWHFKGENVHDFAFTADPSYRLSTAYWNGVECVGIAQEPHAARWQNSATYTARIIKLFSEEIGMYGYPKMVAADANDGMEYPMITLDGGGDPSYRGLLVHEIGHNWFYGMVGSNETYRAGMDEGFTQYLTGMGLKALEGEWSKPRFKSKWRSKIADSISALDRNVYNVYTYDALNKNELPLNTHANDFHDALGHENGYRQVYYKTGSMLYNLQYVLGDSLFKAAMQHYFEQWKFAHPYFEDFRASIIQFTNADLTWFFDQWLETTKTIDYKITSIKKKKGGNWEIGLKRKGLMQMPIEFTVTDKKGKQQSYYIPNTWFSKAQNGTELPKWYGWSKINPCYTATIKVPNGIRKVQLDTSFRLADRYLPDNVRYAGFMGWMAGLRVTPDDGAATTFNRRKYRLFWRPDLWWNPIDGIKAGLHLEGDYLFTVGRLDATAWWNTHALQYDRFLSYESEDYYQRYYPVNYSVNFNTPLLLRFPKLELSLGSRFLDGLWRHQAGLNLKADDNNTVQLYYQTLWRPDALQTGYLIYPQEWSSFSNRRNASLNLVWQHSYNRFGNSGSLTTSLRAPFLAGNGPEAFDYAYGQLEWFNYRRLDKLEIRTRLFGRYGTGTRLPYESLLFAAGANPEEMMENKYTRSIGFAPESWEGINRYEPTHLAQGGLGGGLNLRGYSGYFMADERNGEILLSYKGRSGAAINAEIDFDEYINLKPRFTRNWLKIDAYLFADAGLMELSRYELPDFHTISPTTMWSDVRVDAGLGMAFTVKKWWHFSKAKPLTLRVDFPFLLNRPSYSDPQYGAFRYVIGINRAF